MFRSKLGIGEKRLRMLAKVAPYWVSSIQQRCTSGIEQDDSLNEGAAPNYAKPKDKP